MLERETLRERGLNGVAMRRIVGSIEGGLVLLERETCSKKENERSQKENNVISKTYQRGLLNLKNVSQMIKNIKILYTKPKKYALIIIPRTRDFITKEN